MQNRDTKNYKKKKKTNGGQILTHAASRMSNKESALT